MDDAAVHRPAGTTGWFVALLCLAGTALAQRAADPLVPVSPAGSDAPAAAAVVAPPTAARGADLATLDKTMEPVLGRLLTLEPLLKAAAAASNSLTYADAAQVASAVVRGVSDEMPAISNVVARVEAANAGIRENECLVDGAPLAGMMVAASSADSRVIDGFQNAANWAVAEWGDPGSLKSDGSQLTVEYAVGSYRKFAINKILRSKLVIRPADTILLDVRNPGSFAVRLAMGLFAGTDYLESKMAVVEPGKQTLRFSLAERSFKSESTVWQYSTALPAPWALDRIALLIYSARPGTLILDDLRFEEPAPAPAATLKPPNP
jgi:hypothetical protein